MKKILLISTFVLLLMTPLFGDSGVVIGYPYSLMYDTPYGAIIIKIPFKKDIEIVEVKRLFTRIKYNGRVGYIANSQYINSKNFKIILKNLKKYGNSHQFCTPSFSRKIPLWDLNLQKIIRYIPPGFVLPVLEEDESLYKVKFVDTTGYIYKNVVDILEYDNIEKNIKIKSSSKTIQNIRLKITVGKNKVYQFFVAVLRYFKIKFKNKTLKNKFQYVREDLTLKDFRDLFKTLGINSKIYTSINNYLLIKTEFKKLNLILFKLKIDDSFKYFLLIGIDQKNLKLLDIFKLSIKQVELYDFMNIFSISSKILIIYYPKYKL